jgi:hypothetical protein
MFGSKNVRYKVDVSTVYIMLANYDIKIIKFLKTY